MNSVEISTAVSKSLRSIPPPQDVAVGDKEVRTANRELQNVVKQQTENTVTAKAPQAPTAAELGDAVESINQFVNAQMRTLNFSVDENSGKSVVKVIDFETKDVIRQIPGEEVLKMASAIKKLQDDLGSATGLLINSKV